MQFCFSCITSCTITTTLEIYIYHFVLTGQNSFNIHVGGMQQDKRRECAMIMIKETDRLTAEIIYLDTWFWSSLRCNNISEKCFTYE